MLRGQGTEQYSIDHGCDATVTSGLTRSNQPLNIASRMRCITLLSGYRGISTRPSIRGCRITAAVSADISDWSLDLGTDLGTKRCAIPDMAWNAM